MRIPKIFEIAGHDIEVKIVNKINKGKFVGESNNDQNRITLARFGDGKEEIADSNKKSTILHEVIHQIAMKHGINLSENTVAALEVGLYQFLSCNDIDFRDREKIRRRKCSYQTF